MTRLVSETERLAWLRLARTPRVGPITFHRLCARYGGPIEALSAAREWTERPGAAPIRLPAEHLIEREAEALRAMGGRHLVPLEPDYPPLLKRMPAPPPVIAALGDPAHAARPCLAIVGARNASAAGLAMAQRLAGAAGAAGYTVVSGLARGIDGAAHKASLPTGTIGVVAGGVDRIYPPEHEDLHRAIAERGLIVSDAPLGHYPRARDFPKRNVIIAGLSLGVVVIEAAERSGTQITARAALELNREVMAVPGSPLDPRAAGSNRLIKQGAALVDGWAAVEEVLSPLTRRRALRDETGDLFETEGAGRAEETPDPALLNRLRALIGPSPIAFDELARLADVSADALAAALTELELEGYAESAAGGAVSRVYGA